MDTEPYPINFNNTEIAFAAKSNAELRKAYLMFRLMNNKTLVDTGTWLATVSLKWRLPVKPLIKYTIYQQFCGGETLQQSLKTIDALAESGVDVFLDYGMEGKETLEAFEHTKDELLKEIAFAKDKPNVPTVSTKITAFVRNHLLEKMQAKAALTEGEQEEITALKKRLDIISKAAHDAGVSIYFDAEESWMQDTLDDLVTELMEKYNQSQPIIFNTFQMYRHDRLAFLKKCHLEARTKGYILAAKPVRGAYMEKERKRATEMGYPSPIQPDKAATDRDFDLALKYCVEHIDDIALCCASHNEESAIYLCELMQQHKLATNHPRIYFAQLYGMSDHISFNLANAGYNVAKYLPYGPVGEVIPYLIRRTEENSSVTGQMGRELTLLTGEMERRGLV